MSRFRAFLILLVFLISAPLFAKERNQLHEFQVIDQQNDLRLVFGLDRHARHNLFKLDNPARIVIDFDNTRVVNKALFGFKAQGAVNGMRHAPQKDGRLRIVFDVDDSIDASSFVRSSPTGHRVMVDLLGALVNKSAKTSVATLQTRKSKPKRSEPVKKKVVVQKPAKAAPAKPKPVAKKPVAKKPGRYRDLVIAVDAGHGGKDPGAVGKYKTKEKDIVLNVARDLANMLNKTPGYKAVLTRDRDVFLPLRERIARARKHKADLFVSIHADAAENRNAKGSSVFVLSQNGASSEAARLLAKRENEAGLIDGVDLKDKDETLAHVLIDLTQRHNIEVSKDVAHSILGRLSKVGNVHGKRVEHAGFVVLKLADIPSVLVETAFISNPAEEKRMRTRKYQKKVAGAILKGIKQHFYKNAEPNTLVAQIRKREHVIRSGETLSGIAVRYRVSMASLKRVNNLRTDMLRIGQKLKIPVSGT